MPPRVPIADQVRKAKQQLAKVLEFATGALRRNNSLAPAVESLMGLGQVSDELMLYLEGRATFINQQIALEQRLTMLDRQRSERLAATLRDGVMLFVEIPELQDPDIKRAVVALAARIEAFDKQGSAKIIQFNVLLRQTQLKLRTAGEHNFANILPAELEL